MSNPTVLLRPNVIFDIFINFTETYVQKIILACCPGEKDNIILQSHVCKVLWHLSDHYLSSCILLYIVTTYVYKTFCFISTWQWQYESRQLCVHCRKTFLRPVMPTSSLLYILTTYVCITILTFLRHTFLSVQCKND
jgi:hypothetical protein